MPPAAWALLSVLGVSLVSLAGVFTLSLSHARLERMLFLLVSFAVGAMLGGAVLHLIPHSYEQIGSGRTTGVLVLVGVVGFFVLEKFLHWRHAHDLPGAPGEGHAGHGHHHAHGAPAPFARMNLIGDVAHNLLDGMVIAAAYLVSVPAGLVTTLAVLLHEIPQEIGDFGVLVYGGYAPRQALAYNFLSALAGLVGAGLSLALGAAVEGYAVYLLPITAGTFLYVAGSDLIPELHTHHSSTAAKSAWQLVMIVLGAGTMLLPEVLENWLGAH